MEVDRYGKPNQALDLDALRQRIDAAADSGGTVYAPNELLDLLGTAAEHADDQAVPAALLIRAVRVAIAGYAQQRVVPLDNETAGTLIDLASGTDVPTIPKQTPGNELELMA